MNRKNQFISAILVLAMITGVLGITGCGECECPRACHIEEFESCCQAEQNKDDHDCCENCSHSMEKQEENIPAALQVQIRSITQFRNSSKVLSPVLSAFTVPVRQDLYVFLTKFSSSPPCAEHIASTILRI